MEVPHLSDLLGQRSTRTFPEHCYLCTDVDSRFVIGFFVAVFIDPFIAGANTHNRPVFDQKLSAGKASEDVYALFLRFLRQPLHKLSKGDDVIAVIVQKRRIYWEL